MKTLILYKPSVKDQEGMKVGLKQGADKLKAIGFDISLEYKETNKVFTGAKYPSGSPEVSNPISVKPEEILQQVAGNYKVACLIYDWTEVTPQPTNPAHHAFLLNGCTPIQIPLQFYTDTTVVPNKTYTEVLTQYFLHELSHALAFLTGQPDKTHLQYMNPAWSQKPPSDYYVYLIQQLQPYWHLLDSVSAPFPPGGLKTVTLTRRWDNGVQTLGELSVDNFSCKTLERPWRNNLPNVSCVPKGTYKCKWNFSPKFMKYTYELQNVSGRSGIRFHSGNFFFDVQGCILLGTHYTDINGDPYADIANSRVTIKKFNELLNKQEFILKIV